MSKAGTRASIVARSLVLVACLGGIFGSQVRAQQAFVDDAGRTVTLPAKVSRVFAAGAPADVLLYTLVPEMLVGRNQTPSAAAMEFIPPRFRTPVAIASLPNADDDKADSELLALKPDVYIDYGDVAPDYVASLTNVQQRTGIPSIILDGRLEKIPETYRKLGAALGVKSRGDLLAAHAERILAKYAGLLAKPGSGPRPRVYLACNADGTSPCLEGEGSAEIARLLGALDVAGALVDKPAQRPTIETIAAWNPDVIVAVNPAALARMRTDPAWQAVPAVTKNRIAVAPTLPFNWGPRPPSVNRLLGLMWLAHVLPGRSFDAGFYGEVRAFFAEFYQIALTDEQTKRLLGN
ncbi:MAG: ABC transporter substrate-binding protein [Steroidobacteraceae bacterium]